MHGTLTPATGAGAAAGFVLFAVAVFTGRADVAVLGVVLLCACGVALARPRAVGPVQVELHRGGTAASGPASTVPVTVHVSAPGADVVVLALREGERRTSFLVLPGPDAVAVVPVVTVHSGRQRLLELTARAIGPDGAWCAPPTAPDGVDTVVRPQPRRLPHLPLPAAPSRLSAAHDARRPGDGGEFRDIHPFTSGDRLQRIDWKATARLARRPGELFVRRTLATSDIDVALVLDDADDVTGVLGDWAHGDRTLALPTSLDVAREAMWSLAAGYLDLGDQVSFQVLSRLRSAVPRGSGARHRERLRVAVAAAGPGERHARTRTPVLPAGAVVLLFSTVLDDEPVRLAGLWRAGGHRVVVVDTLPRPRTERLSRPEQAAARILLAEREDRLDAVRAVGADVLAWDAGAGARSAALRAMARTRRRA